MKCRYYRKLSEYQTGALEAPTAARVQAHVAHCPACRRELQALQATADLLQPLPQADAPADTWRQVQARLQPRRRAAAGRIRQWAPVFAAALILLVLVSGLTPLGHQALVNHLQPGDNDGYSQIQLAAAWDAPLADKAALGLALIAYEGNPNELELTD